MNAHVAEEIGNIDKDAIEIIDFIFPPETDYANRDIVISTENYYDSMAREAREDESNVEEVMLVTPIQVLFPEQSQQIAIKGTSQLEFDAVSDEGSSGYDSDQVRLARLSDPNYTTVTQLKFKRNARLQAKKGIKG
ncbi:unnamed protein product [Cuscuta europaea]|uniref:Uncharacterized protein n=1 Tax=Cuscuta europaea TaxID=41803 RepID=A0A9P0YS96_CUSEU|nr:unnamed protein product [Cuscuta europaea]